MKREPDVPLPRFDGPAEDRAAAICIESATCRIEPRRCQQATPCQAGIAEPSNASPCRGRGDRHA